MMDIEQHLNENMLSKMSGAQVLHYAEEFAGTVFDETGRGVMTYVSPGLHAGAGQPRSGPRRRRLGRCLLVRARDAADTRRVSKEPCGRTQFSDHGTFPGVGSRRRPRVWLGNAKSLEAWLEGHPVAGGGGARLAGAHLSTKETQTLLKQIGFPIAVDGTRGGQDGAGDQGLPARLPRRPAGQAADAGRARRTRRPRRRCGKRQE